MCYPKANPYTGRISCAKQQLDSEELQKLLALKDELGPGIDTTLQGHSMTLQGAVVACHSCFVGDVKRFVALQVSCLMRMRRSLNSCRTPRSVSCSRWLWRMMSRWCHVAVGAIKLWSCDQLWCGEKSKLCPTSSCEKSLTDGVDYPPNTIVFGWGNFDFPEGTAAQLWCDTSWVLLVVLVIQPYDTPLQLIIISHEQWFTSVRY